jgi:hypothetical protein
VNVTPLAVRYLHLYTFWLAGWLILVVDLSWLAGWLAAGWLAGWLAGLLLLPTAWDGRQVLHCMGMSPDGAGVDNMLHGYFVALR